ncbi:hypothetical protein ASG35_27785 [Burkholderia sp. Leaf177]|nr:hypothetical protein ASG35_27785 [Burkholderia sp. Leaf177]
MVPSNVDKKSRDGEVAVRLCNYTDVYYSEQILANVNFMPATATAGQIERLTLQAGDTLITKDSETAADIAIAAYVPQSLPGVVCGYHLAVVRPGVEQDGLFIKRLFDSHYLKSYFEVSARGLTRFGLPQYALDNVAVAFPTLAEQRAIAFFLNRETGKIDELIAQQEKLLKLLAEKRQATISKAVTHGLDHKVSTKLSEHDFVGSIPSHWCIYPIKAVATINDESLPEDTEPDFELSYVDIGNVSLNRGIEGTEVLNFAEAPSRARRIARHGDVIISTVRTYLKAIAPIVNPPSNLIVSTGFAVIRPKQNLSSAFAKYAMQSAAFIDEIISKSTGVSYPAINASDLGRMALPIPPLDEQAAISAFLDNTTKALDALIKIQNRANHLLKERRTALISAAVTGKIDVRDYVDDEAPAMNAAPIA